MSVTVFVVDDEPLARAKLRRLIDKEVDFELIGESANGRDAVEVIRALRPQVVFLDIQMPELDGFGVLHALSPEERPLIVFVTAHDQHALRAFDVNATDYLLKPFGAARFQATLARVRSWLANRSGAPPFLERVTVSVGARQRVVALTQVEWIEAKGNYVQLHHSPEPRIPRTPSGELLLRQSLAGMLAQLDPTQFVRVHRGAVVNVARIAEVHPRFSGDCLLTLNSGTRLRVSRNFRPALDKQIGR